MQLKLAWDNSLYSLICTALFQICAILSQYILVLEKLISFTTYFMHNLFRYFSALELRLASGQSFDYETRTFYNLTFTVDDSMASTTSILYINIQNAFEACYFDQSLYHVSAAEGAVRICRSLTSDYDVHNVFIITNMYGAIGHRSFKF